MRVAVVTVGKPTDLGYWSGIPAHICFGLGAAGIDVVPVGPLKAKGFPSYRLASGLRNAVLPRRHKSGLEPWVLRRYGRHVDDSLRTAGDIDLVVAPGTPPVAYGTSRTPVVIWADATVGVMLGYYPEFTNWTRHSVRAAIDAERRALARCALFVGASEWVAEAAVSEYGIPQDKVAVVPFGANVDSDPRPSQRSPLVGRTIRLLAVGAFWERKGMDIAIATARQLKLLGVPAELDIVGAQPPRGTTIPPYVRVHGFLRKDLSEHRQLIDHLYRRADMFLLPTQAECFGVVFCEAAAYGLPSVAPRTGGIPTAIVDGRTGILVEPRSSEREYAHAIRDLVSSQDRYDCLSVGARRKFESELNWRSACQRVIELARERGH